MTIKYNNITLMRVLCNHINDHLQGGVDVIDCSSTLNYSHLDEQGFSEQQQEGQEEQEQQRASYAAPASGLPFPQLQHSCEPSFGRASTQGPGGQGSVQGERVPGAQDGVQEPGGQGSVQGEGVVWGSARNGGASVGEAGKGRHGSRQQHEQQQQQQHSGDDTQQQGRFGLQDQEKGDILGASAASSCVGGPGVFFTGVCVYVCVCLCVCVCAV